MLESVQERWIQFAQGEAPITWDLWGSRCEDMVSLTDKGKQVAQIAIKELAEFFGGNYLERCRGHEHPLFSLSYPTWNDTAGAARNLFDLYAHVALLANIMGVNDIRKDLRNKPTFDTWQHAMIQFELAAFALARGYDCEFEPKLPSGKKGDVYVKTPESSLFFEALSIETSDDFQNSNNYYHEMIDFLTHICSHYNINITGELKIRPNDSREFQVIQHTINEIAVSLQEVGQQHRIDDQFVSLRIRKSLQPGYPNVSGIESGTDTWKRLSTRIRKKSFQSSGAQNAWLRFDEGSGMWYFTQWSGMSLKEKLREISPLLQATIQPFSHVSGVILTNGWGVQTDKDIDTIHVHNGNVAICRAFPGGTFRETLIVRRDKSVRKSVRELVDWYSSEPKWLDWALNYLGHPTLRELINS